jgi:hypothetical protein
MGSFLVVVNAPLLIQKPYIFQTVEQVCIQKFLSHRSIFALNEGVLYRLTRLDELKTDVSLFAPAMKTLADELGPVIYSDGLGSTSVFYLSLQHPDDPRCRQ